MCQLLGMNCNVPTDICFSFSGFRRRGGATDVHRDGWGIGFFEGKGVRLFLDPEPSADSPLAELVRHYPIRSLNVIAHIRKATAGRVALENTHPFMREIWGQCWLFAHNGHLPHFLPPLDGGAMPVGDTDSERLFCWLLQELRRRFAGQPPQPDELFSALHELTGHFAGLGIANYLLSNGTCLIAHSSTQLYYIIRRAPFGEAHLADDDLVIDFSQVTTPRDCVAVIATAPLTVNEQWEKMPAGTLWLFRDGVVTRRRATQASPVQTVDGPTASG